MHRKSKARFRPERDQALTSRPESDREASAHGAGRFSRAVHPGSNEHAPKASPQRYFVIVIRVDHYQSKSLPEQIIRGIKITARSSTARYALALFLFSRALARLSPARKLRLSGIHFKCPALPSEEESAGRKCSHQRRNKERAAEGPLKRSTFSSDVADETDLRCRADEFLGLIHSGL